MSHCARLPVQVLCDGDAVLWDGWETRNADNVQRWRALWRAPRTPLESRPVPDDELARAGAALVNELERYPSHLRTNAPGECQVLIRDTGRGAMLDLRGARFQLLDRPDEREVIAELDAEDLLFMLRFPWGADTLYVSSCFVARDMQRWGQLIAFRHGMYTAPVSSAAG